MATKEVSTWDGLVTAINGFADGDIIKLTADIDLNREYPTGVASCNITQSSAGSYALTIDGDGHTIKNLSTSITDPQSIFLKNSDGFSITLTFQDIDFVNLILSGAPLVSVSGSNDDAIVCNNCRFVGKRTAAYLINRNQNVTLNSCYFNIPWQGANLSTREYISLTTASDTATTVVANYCWFHEHYMGWIMPNGFDYNGEYDTVYFSFGYMKINGCYIDGDSVCTHYKIGNTSIANCIKFMIKPNTNAYTPSSQNVFDCSVVVMNGRTADSTFSVGNFGGLMKKDVTIKDSTTVVSTFNNDSYIGNSAKVYPIKATAEQMKDASWLSSQGFDIIVPQS